VAGGRLRPAVAQRHSPFAGARGPAEAKNTYQVNVLIETPRAEAKNTNQLNVLIETPRAEAKNTYQLNVLIETLRAEAKHTYQLNVLIETFFVWRGRRFQSRV
jgi:hypothetical protein